MQLLSHNMHRWSYRIAELNDFFYRLTVTIIQTFRDSRFVFHTIGKFRRLWLVHFRKKYVQHQLFIREGDCRQCGTCCNLLFTCPVLMKQGYCLIYGVCRPQSCKVFPIDQRDIQEVEVCGGTCGYRFSSRNS